MTRHVRLLSVGAVLAVATATSSVVGITPGAAGGSAGVEPEVQAIAAHHLAADASGPLTRRSDRGLLDFVGVPAGERVDNPRVSSSTGVVAAADAHLARYGAALGTEQRGTTIARGDVVSTLAGDVVRYQQRVGGLPVLAGELVVSLRGDRELDSILAKTTRSTKVSDAQVTESAAAETAQASFQRVAGRGAPARIDARGRWVIDPALIGGSADLPVRTAWRFELTRGAHERREVLVDDQTGLVLMDTDRIGHAKRRIVCDNANVQQPSGPAPDCVDASVTKVRGEGDPPAALAEANAAYDLGGFTHDAFAVFGIADLTELIGRDIGGGVKALSQTVRYCVTGGGCPTSNAFWNGLGVYYGAGSAVDDQVGHELAHGVTERTSGLVYFGQSGAINESLSDIFGEIIDHRNASPGDTPGDFRVGEDMTVGAIRDMADPTVAPFFDPDRTGSPLYVTESCGPASCYPDNDAVHQNSGVGNKTFYLASQGGSFNGQTLTGVDAGDPALTKSGRLWLLVDQSLTSGSDYADLGVVLSQACASLQGMALMTAADCASVAKAGVATQLAATPATNPQPADAPATCPSGTSKQVLLDSEAGTPGTTFTADTGWTRAGTTNWGQIAHSAPDAWSNQGTEVVSTLSLTAAAPILIPAGQTSYLHFHHWRLLQYSNNTFFDGGRVEIDAAPPAGAWVNGPTQTMAAGNPIAGQLAFGGDSRGYVASRLDLSSYAGTSITPRFTLYSNSSGIFLGWWLDDITVYTCAPTGNTAPVVDAGADAVVALGATFSSSGGFTDDVPAGATATVNYGDGTGTMPLAMSGTTFSLSHTYATLGPKTVTVSVTDAGSVVGSDTATVTVNAAPVVNAGPDGTATMGSPYTSSGSFNDEAPVGASATVNYGDGTGTQPLALAGTLFTLSHTYATTGPKTVTVTVTDAGAFSGTDTATVTVNPAPALAVTVGTVAIKGTTVVGKKLKAKVSGWSPAGLTYTFEWLRNGKVVSGAAGKKYTLTNKDLGKKIRVRVTGSRSGYTSGVATSKKTGKIEGTA